MPLLRRQLYQKSSGSSFGKFSFRKNKIWFKIRLSFCRTVFCAISYHIASCNDGTGLLHSQYHPQKHITVLIFFTVLTIGTHGSPLRFIIPNDTTTFYISISMLHAMSWHIGLGYIEGLYYKLSVLNSHFFAVGWKFITQGSRDRIFETRYNISREICTRFCCALLCCGYAIVHNEFTWSIYPYSSGLLCWHWGNR